MTDRGIHTAVLYDACIQTSRLCVRGCWLMLCQGGQPSRCDGDRASSSCCLSSLPSHISSRCQYLITICSVLQGEGAPFYPTLLCVRLFFPIPSLCCESWSLASNSLFFLARLMARHMAPQSWKWKHKGFCLAFVLHQVSQSIHLDCMHERPGLIKRGPSFSQISCVFCTYILFFFFFKSLFIRYSVWRGGWSLSQLSWGEGRVRLGKITSLPQSWQQPLSHKY